MKESPVSFWYQDIIKNNDWFNMFKPLGDFTENYDFLNDGAINKQLVTASSPDLKLSAFALKSVKRAYAFVYDINNGSDISNAKLYIKGLPYGYYKIHFISPETGDSTLADNVPLIRNTDIVNLPLFSKEIAARIMYAADYTLPIAIAGEDTTIALGQSILLDASKSYNPSGAELEYEWSLVSKPNASTISIQNNTLEQITLIPDVAGTYIIGLTVNDTANTSAPDQVIIRVSASPIAVAPDDTTVLIKKTLKLDGNRSHDPEQDSLTYKWNLISSPAGSKAKLTGAATKQAKITPDIIGEYIVTLVVNDGYSDSKPDTAVITAVESVGVLTYQGNTGAYLYINPNPVRDVLKVNYFAGSDARLDILDINGKIVGNYILDKSNPAYGQLTININNYGVSGGIYLIRLTSNKDCIVRKVIYNP
jgi:hypothetical protein